MSGVLLATDFISEKNNKMGGGGGLSAGRLETNQNTSQVTMSQHLRSSEYLPHKINGLKKYFEIFLMWD